MTVNCHVRFIGGKEAERPLTYPIKANAFSFLLNRKYTRRLFFMPFVDSEGIRIHYKTEGEGPPLVFHHWSLATLEDWFDYGYVSAMKDEYQLILLDARGHGSSDKPHESDAYTLKKRVGDIVAILDDLNIDQAHYCGYSMGGWIGFGVAQYAPERFQSLIVGEAHPYAQSMEGLRKIVNIGIERGPEACFDEWKKAQGRITSEKRMLEYDYKALLAVAQDRESQEAILPKIEMPCLLYVGEDDENICALAKKCSSQIANAKFNALPGLDHGGTIMQSDAVVPHIKKFLSTLNQ